MRKLTSMITLLSLAATAVAQQAIAPNPAVFAGGGTSGNIWRAGLNRVQCFYDSSNFSGQALGQPITISNLEWQCGAAVAAAITYPSVEIYVQNAAVDFAAPSTTFAANRTVALPTTPNYAGPVTLNAGASGAYVINLPLTIPFQYTADAGQDLLVEIVILANPTPLAGMTTSTAFSNPAHLANSIRSVGSTTATVGAASAFCPIVRVGYTEVPGGAKNVTYGAGCNNLARSFYEVFPGAANDLSNKTVTMTQNLSGGYDVATTAGASFTAPTGLGLGLDDDTLSAPQTLPFTFDYPGGSTTSIVVDSNGSVNLNGAGASLIGGTAASLLTSTVHRLSPAMQDMLPDLVGNVNNCYANVDPNNANVYLITWLNVPNFGAAVPTGSTFQVALIDNGTNDSVEFRFQTVVNDSSSNTGTMITGFSLGGAANDPGNRDLTAGTFSTAADLGALKLAASARPVMGNPITYTLSNIRAIAGLSAMNIAFASTPAIPLATYGLNAPNCFGHIDVLGSAPFGPLFLSSPSASFIQTWPSSPAYVGVDLFAQGFELAPLENAAGVITSNGLQIRLGNL